MVIEDLGDEIALAMKAEQEAQEAYEAQRDASKKILRALRRKITNLENGISNRKRDRNAEQRHLRNNQDDLNDEINYQSLIKPDCDWTIDNWQARRDMRQAEKD